MGAGPRRGLAPTRTQVRERHASAPAQALSPPAVRSCYCAALGPPNGCPVAGIANVAAPTVLTQLFVGPGISDGIVATVPSATGGRGICLVRASPPAPCTVAPAAAGTRRSSAAVKDSARATGNGRAKHTCAATPAAATSTTATAPAAPTPTAAGADKGATATDKAASCDAAQAGASSVGGAASGATWPHAPRPGT